MNPTTRTLLVVDGSHHATSRTAALAANLAQRSLAALAERGDESRWTAYPLALRDVGRDLLDGLLTGASSSGSAWVREVTGCADALVLATPCHNASFSALTKLYLDVLGPQALTGLPTLVAVAGASPRHTLVADLVVRPVVSGLGASVVPTAVYAADIDWATTGAGSGASPSDALADRCQRAADELADAAQARTIGERSRRGSRLLPV